jgi:uncharacterized protein with HEPN domain
MIIATRNRLIHGYLGIDNDTLWSIYPDRYSRIVAAIAAATKNRNMSSNTGTPVFASAQIMK